MFLWTNVNQTRYFRVGFEKRPQDLFLLQSSVLLHVQAWPAVGTFLSVAASGHSREPRLGYRLALNRSPSAPWHMFFFSSRKRTHILTSALTTASLLGPNCRNWVRWVLVCKIGPSTYKTQVGAAWLCSQTPGSGLPWNLAVSRPDSSKQKIVHNTWATLVLWLSGMIHCSLGKEEQMECTEGVFSERLKLQKQESVLFPPRTLGRSGENLISKPDTRAEAWFSIHTGMSMRLKQSWWSPSSKDITHLTWLHWEIKWPEILPSCLGYSSGRQVPWTSSDSSFFPEWTWLRVLCGNCLLTKQSDHCQMWAPGQLLHNLDFSLLKMVQFKRALEVLF